MSLERVTATLRGREMRSEERVQQEHSIYVLFCFGVLLRQGTRKYQDVTLTPAVF